MVDALGVAAAGGVAMSSHCHQPICSPFLLERLIVGHIALDAQNNGWKIIGGKR